jgi:hypothetical protein
MSEQNPHDPALNSNPCYRILRDAPLDLATKADAFDDFFESSSASNLALRLERFDLPDHVRTALLQARQALEPDERRAVVHSLDQLSRLDPAVLEMAQKYPTVLQHLIQEVRRNSSRNNEPPREPESEGGQQ